VSEDKIRDAIYAYLSALANPVRAGTYVGYIRPLQAGGPLKESWLKCSEEHFNAVKAEFVKENHLNPKTGANMARPKKLNPEEHTKADLMRHILRAQPDISRSAAGEIYGDPEMFASSQFSTLKTEIKEELKKKARKNKAAAKKAGSNGVDKKKGSAFVASTHAVGEMTSEVEKLRYDNAYLKWQLLGERQGFFERWLEENDG
jgi:hypothetical protein